MERRIFSQRWRAQGQNTALRAHRVPAYELKGSASHRFRILMGMKNKAMLPPFTLKNKAMLTPFTHGEFNGGVKGKHKSKKDKLREAAAKAGGE